MKSPFRAYSYVCLEWNLTATSSLSVDFLLDYVSGGERRESDRLVVCRQQKERKQRFVEEARMRNVFRWNSVSEICYTRCVPVLTQSASRFASRFDPLSDNTIERRVRRSINILLLRPLIREWDQSFRKHLPNSPLWMQTPSRLIQPVIQSNRFPLSTVSDMKASQTNSRSRVGTRSPIHILLKGRDPRTEIWMQTHFLTGRSRQKRVFLTPNHWVQCLQVSRCQQEKSRSVAR